MTDIEIPRPPPKAPPVNYAQIVSLFGQRVWGANWPSGMGRLTGINPRTLARIYAAAREGRDYPAARGVLAALGRELTPVMDDLKPWVRHASED